MAKFKVGDKVLIDVWPDKGLVGTVKEIDYGGHPGNVYVDYGTGAGSVPESKLRPANSRACNSTNPVVANAMRASGGVARNAETSSANDIKVADFLQKAKSRIGAEINTLGDTVKLASRYALSDKGKSDLAALKNILTKLTSAGLHL